MEYPDSKFTRPWRLTMLAFFITAFFVISPLLVLYTTGYRYDFVHGIVQKIGAISIDILPTDASVFLNDAKIENKMPIRLKNVAPGKYKIKITAAGFYDWEKEVAVESKQTIYIKEIKLIKKSSPIKILDKKIDGLYLSNLNNFIFYQTSENPPQFWLRDIAKNSDSKIFSGTLGKKYQIDLASEKNTFITISSDDFTEIYIINYAAPEKFWNLAEEEKNKIIKFQWSTNSQPEIYYSTKNQLLTIDAITKQKSVIGKNIFLDWYEDGGQIWTIQNTTSTNQLAIIKNTFGFSENFLYLNNTENRNVWEFVKTTDNQVLLKKNGQLEMLLANKNKQYNFFGNDFISSQYNNWWIMWTPWELTTYSQGEEPFLLNRSGEQLRKVLILDEYNTLGLIWADKMTALFPYYFVSHNMINSRVNDAVADSENRILYFSANLNKQDGLWKMDY